jgi:hypothetical protein
MSATLRGREMAVGVARSHADRAAREVDVAPAECDELALPQTSECRSQVDRAVLLGIPGSDECHDLLGREYVDVGAGRGSRLLDVGDWVGREAKALAGSLHDAVEDDDRLLARAIREPAVRVDLVGCPVLDSVGCQLVEFDLAQVRQNVVAEAPVRKAMLGSPGGTPLALVSEDVAGDGSIVHDDQAAPNATEANNLIRFGTPLGHNHEPRQGETADLQRLLSAPGRTRTCDLRIRSPLLYPAELQGPAGAA